MQLLVATTNLHKLDEIKSYLDCADLELKSLLDFPGYPEVVEDGDTFESNALKKALAYAEFTGLVTLADDSGLEIDALGGDPGVMSARFAGPGATSKDLCDKVIGLLADIPWEKRTARFKCVMALVGKTEVDLADGTVEGYINTEIQGTEGFGYDPVFYYPPAGLTFAQIGMEMKNSISHRGSALLKIKKLLDKYKTIR